MAVDFSEMMEDEPTDSGPTVFTHIIETVNINQDGYYEALCGYLKLPSHRPSGFVMCPKCAKLAYG